MKSAVDTVGFSLVGGPLFSPWTHATPSPGRTSRVRGLTCLMVVICIGTACGQYGGGLGTLEDPYQIWTPEQMNQIGLHSEDWDKHFALMADIDLGPTWAMTST